MGIAVSALINRLGFFVVPLAGALLGGALNIGIDHLVRRDLTFATPDGVRHFVGRWRSLAVVGATALMFWLGSWHRDIGVLLASRLTFGCALIVLFATDLETLRLPNAITIPGIFVGVVFS